MILLHRYRYGNGVRLAVAEVTGGRKGAVAKHTEICNLGIGVDATGLLTSAPERYMAAPHAEALRAPALRLSRGWYAYFRRRP